MADSTGCIIESQVDYLRVSAHGEEKAGRLEDFAQHLAEEEKAKGNKPKPWRLMGYDGTHCGQVQYGRRDRGATILDLIGDSSAKQLAQALSLADRCTRVDLAVTWRADPPDPHIGPNAYSEAEAWYKDHPQAPRPSRTTDGDGGWTTYIGRRGSENFFRIYDKGQEARAKDDGDGFKRYENTWRFELEAKGTVSLPLAEAVNTTLDPERFVQGYLYVWLRDHGVTPPFRLTGHDALSQAFVDVLMPTASFATLKRTYDRLCSG